MAEERKQFSVHFGRKDEPATVLRASDDLIAVRTHDRQPLLRATGGGGGPVAPPAAAQVADGQLVAAFPEAGVEVYRVPVDREAKSLEVRKSALAAEPDVRFAGTALEDEAGEPVVYTENVFVKFQDDADPEACREALREAGLEIKKEVRYAPNAFFAGTPEGTGRKVFDVCEGLFQRADVEYCHPEVVRERQAKAIFAPQWHLRTAVVNGVTISASANVEAAHARGALGVGVTIAIIDDGVDVEHPEFAAPGKIVAPRDATLGTDDPRPKRAGNRHGTACAGVACAEGRDGASGVAPKARLMPIRLSSALGAIQEGEAFAWAADHGADVISCSWGPTDGAWFDPADPAHATFVPLPGSTRLAIDYAATQGRGGKGCVILFAAGNGNEPVENDGYASYANVVSVAACNDRGRRSAYSDKGAALWCSFPSNDFEFAAENHPAPRTPGIWTTDRTGTAGYNPGASALVPGQAPPGDAAGNYTNSFGGTSSACPGAAGVAALVLSVNPALRGEQVREVLRRCCDRIDPGAGAYDANGRSALYGFGRLNAETAVLLAKPVARNVVRIVRDLPVALPDRQTVSVPLDVAETTAAEDVAVEVEIQHTFIGDLVVTLVPPPGSGMGRVVLHNRSGGAARDLRRVYDAAAVPALAGLRGRSLKGRWNLEVRDTAVRDEGRLLRFGLHLTLPMPADPDDRGADAARPAAARNGKAAAASSSMATARARKPNRSVG